MDILSIGLYLSIVVVVYKGFHIVPSKWNVTTTAIIGVFLIGSIFLGMSYFHPLSIEGRSYFVSVPIISDVRGHIESVYVEETDEVKKGDKLFQIEQTPFIAELKKTVAQRDFYRQRVQEQQVLYKQQAGRLYDLQTYQLQLSKAESDLETAQFNFDKTTIRAPFDGIVTQLRVRPGVMSVPLPFAPLASIIDTETTVYAAAFRQLTIANIKTGFNVEAIVPSLPGRVFRGKVMQVLPAISPGEVQASGTLVALEEPTDERYIVYFDFGDSLKEFDLPRGHQLTVAVYSDKIEFLAIIRQILLRMMSWEYFLHFEIL